MIDSRILPVLMEFSDRFPKEKSDKSVSLPSTSCDSDAFISHQFSDVFFKTKMLHF